MQFGNFIGRLIGHHFDIHTAGTGGDEHWSLLRPVIGDTQVDLLADRYGLIHQNFSHRQVFDLHREDLRGDFFGFFRCLHQPDPAGFTAPAHQHLGFYHHFATQFLA